MKLPSVWGMWGIKIDHNIPLDLKTTGEARMKDYGDKIMTKVNGEINWSEKIRHLFRKMSMEQWGKFLIIRNFTLMELLTVIAIIVILASILLPVLNNARQVVYGIQCLNNLKQVNLANSMYQSDFNGYSAVYKMDGADPWYLPTGNIFGPYLKDKPNAISYGGMYKTSSTYVTEKGYPVRSKFACPVQKEDGTYFHGTIGINGNFGDGNSSDDNFSASTTKDYRLKHNLLRLGKYQMSKLFYFNEIRYPQTTAASALGQYNRVGARHNNKMTAAFADGHCALVVSGGSNPWVQDADKGGSALPYEVRQLDGFKYAWGAYIP